MAGGGAKLFELLTPEEHAPLLKDCRLLTAEKGNLLLLQVTSYILSAITVSLSLSPSLSLSLSRHQSSVVCSVKCVVCSM